MDRSLVALAIALPHVSATRALRNSTYTSVETGDLHRTFEVRLAALICSSVSMTTSLVAFYWFCRMEKRFRHRLIMLLIYGDLMRATWFFIFAVVSLARGAVRTESAFCQSSGFLIQFGTETSDYAVLAIAVNSALQVFQPNTQSTSEGLYPYQRYVYAGALLIPGIMSALAFINTRWGYLSQGAFCTLPIRPFWYRLALAWIPRYLIALTVIGLAIAIYTYVGFEFRAYSTLSQSIRTSMATSPTRASMGERPPEPYLDVPVMAKLEPIPGRRASSIAHDIVSSPRRTSSIAFNCAGPSSNQMPFLPGTSTSTQSLPISSIPFPLRRSDTIRPTLSAIPSGSTIRSPHSSGEPGIVVKSSFEDSVFRPLSRTLSRGRRHMARQRVRQNRDLHARVHRQLQLMFIYPLVYTLMWLLPFIQHCTMYQDKYALQPLWFLRLGTTICMASMGFVDSLIFTLREKPWQKIQRSDGTFWGSFAIFRAPRAMNGNLIGGDMEDAGGGDPVTLQRALTDGGGQRIMRMRSSIRTSSSSNDHVIMAAEQARKRLELEREERLAAMRERVVKRHSLMNNRETAEGDDDDSWSTYDDGQGEEPDPKPQDIGHKGKGKAAEV